MTHAPFLASRQPAVIQQKGAALISAMLVVTLVATLASVALWQQWRYVEIESAERHRVQSAWLLNSALDWSRLILREDAMSNASGSATKSGSAPASSSVPSSPNAPPAALAGTVDHLGEPWALPLKEAKLSSFLAQDQQLREGDPEVFLSGQVTDAQSRLNLANWTDAADAKSKAQLLDPMQKAMVRLFNVLGLPRSELAALSAAWLAAAKGQGNLMPQNVAQLQWLGLSKTSVQRLSPFVTLLPESTPLNLNTASAEAIYASLPGLDLATAKQFVQQRTLAHFDNLAEAAKVLKVQSLDPKAYSVNSRYFEVWGRLRMEDRAQEETALIFRNNGQVNFVWRQKIAGILPPPGPDSLLQSSQP
jgi:general secretion pathway protein K